MDSVFSDFPKEFDSLEPAVRSKALEIARELINKEALPEEEAIHRAIEIAQEWYYGLE